MKFRRTAARVAGAFLVLACGGSDSTIISPISNTPGLTLSVLSGDGQSTQAGSVLPNQIVIRIMNLNGAPASGQVVQIALMGGGSIGPVSVLQAGADGLIHLNWTLGAAVGQQTLQATAVDPRDGLSYSVTATATATPVPVANVVVDSPNVSFHPLWSSTITATPRDANGNALGGRTATWQSSDPSIVSVYSAGSQTGAITGVASGTATITATIDGKTAAVNVSVTPAAIAVFGVSHDPALPADRNGTPYMRDGQTVQMTPHMLDARGNVLTGRSVSWEIRPDSTSLTVSSSGLVTAHKNWGAVVYAWSEGMLAVQAFGVYTYHLIMASDVAVGDSVSVGITNWVGSPACNSMQSGPEFTSSDSTIAIPHPKPVSPTSTVNVGFVVGRKAGTATIRVSCFVSLQEPRADESATLIVH